MNNELINKKLNELVNLVSGKEPELLNEKEIEKLRVFLEEFYEEITKVAIIK
jgi:hypothetical protein